MSDITWTIVSVTLDQLQPWDGNPKTSTAKNQAQLNDSADDLGQFQTIAVGPFDGNGKAPVYDGHQRLSAWKAKHGGKLAVQALQSSRPLTDQERRKIAIYSRQIGAWDWDVLSAWEPTELTAWGFDVDLLTDWRRDVAALGDFLESEEEFEKPEGLPNPRNLPIDVIFTGGFTAGCCLAVASGFKYGIQSSDKVCPRAGEHNYHKTFFVDNDYFNYDHAVHLAFVKKEKPKYATVRDVMTPEQCRVDGIPYYDFFQILEWAEELSEHAENVIVIPKYDCLDKIPDKFMLGYSVPTSHGGTPLPPESFKGRRVHLLGGSWKNQLAHLAAIGDDVVSLDTNYIAKQADFGNFVLPDGNSSDLISLGFGSVVNPKYCALSLSLGNIGAKINELYRPPDGGNGTENFDMVVTATNHKKQGDFVECHNEPSIVLFWYVLLMLPRKCWQTSPA